MHQITEGTSMIAQEYINQLVPSVQKGDPTDKIFDWMDEFGVQQLPVVENGKYYGIISESDLFDLDLTHGVNSLEYALIKHQEVYVTQYMHLYEVLYAVEEHDTDILPVLDDQKHYIGSIIIKDLVKAVASMFASQMPGGIVVLQVDAIQYSLAEISRLVESNNTRILSTYIQHIPDDPQKMLVTLKVNTKDLSYIIATFERFNYQIISQFSDEDVRNNRSERIQMLLKYLEL
ncbi:CBS domain-containing protein [Limibacter armeniacum]|uniref:CBS domain-containing protein n=1 Tax=Limibacter armeniacum TaxID=466084 RepID=UPI002FE662C2